MMNKYIGKIINKYSPIDKIKFLDLSTQFFVNSTYRDFDFPRRLFFNLKTPLCKIMIKNGSDKAGYYGESQHNYTTLYHELFSNKINKSVRVFEMGIGTTNPEIVSNMGIGGVPGASLMAWSSYFKNGLIYGADIDKTVLFQTEKIRTFFCDQTSSSSILQMWSLFDPGIKFDIIIDDGLHTFDANISLFENSNAMLSDTGWYIIEDVFYTDLSNWKQYLKGQNQFMAALICIPNPFNKKDNNLILFKRK